MKELIALLAAIVLIIGISGRSNEDVIPKIPNPLTHAEIEEFEQDLEILIPEALAEETRLATGYHSKFQKK